jgi:anti-sigma B factor antagonist
MLNIEATKNTNEVIFSLRGRLDTVTAPDLERELQQVLPGLKALTLDFEKLDYISSAGLRVLLSAQKQMNKQGQMRLIHVGDAIMEILEVTGFTEILTIE